MHALEGVVEFGVGVLVKGVQVRADGAGEKDRVLRYDCDAASEVVEADFRHVDAVNVDGTLARL